MKRRSHAMGAAFVLSLLPLGASISILITALVTLRKGAFEGSWVLVATLAPYLLGYAVTPAISQIVLAATITVVVIDILTWLLAVILRERPQWGLVIEIAAFIGLVLIVLIHGIFPELQNWWVAQLTAYLNKTATLLGSLATNDVGTADEMRVLAANTKRYIVGFVIASVVLNALLQLLIARWWQAAIFNPGGLRKELHQIRLSYVFAAAFIAIMGLAYTGNALGVDMMPIMITVFCIAGLSMIHYGLASKKASLIWIVMVYLGIIFIFPMGIALVSLVGLLDSMLNLRQRLTK